MSDVASQIPTTASTPAPEAPATPPAPSFTQDQVQAMINQGIAQALAAQAQAAAPPGPAPAKPVAETNRFSKGEMVSHSFFDVYTGRTETRYGIVVDTLPNEGAGARSTVVWFHELSGPIGDEQLEGA